MTLAPRWTSSLWLYWVPLAVVLVLCILISQAVAGLPVLVWPTAALIALIGLALLGGALWTFQSSEVGYRKRCMFPLTWGVTILLLLPVLALAVSFQDMGAPFITVAGLIAVPVMVTLTICRAVRNALPAGSDQAELDRRWYENNLSVVPEASLIALADPSSPASRNSLPGERGIMMVWFIAVAFCLIVNQILSLFGLAQSELVQTGTLICLVPILLTPLVLIGRRIVRGEKGSSSPGVTALIIVLLVIVLGGAGLLAYAMLTAPH